VSWPQLSTRRGPLRALWRRVARRPTLPEATLLVVLMGAVWLVLEFALRGGESAVRLDWRVIAGVGISGVLVGLATRARVSMRGELVVGGDFLVIVLLVISLLPAVMLLVYGAAFIASAGVVSLTWLLWGVCLVLALLVQAAVYGGAAGVIYTTISEGFLWALIATAVYCFTMSWIASAIGGGFANAWNFALPHWAFERKELIPEWTFAVQALRHSLAPLDHGRLMSVISSIAGGAGLGLAASISLRLVRQRLMTNVALRRYLPMAAAPLPDDIPLLDRRTILPLLVYSVVGWSLVLAWKVV
jgi:hypothetical protein